MKTLNFSFFRHFTWKSPLTTSSSDQVECHTKGGNERLAGACLDLLQRCGRAGKDKGEGDPPIDFTSTEGLSKVMDMLLRESYHTPADQFDIVYDALCSPLARDDIQVRQMLMIVLESITPIHIYHLFESEDLIRPVVDQLDEAAGAARRLSLQKYIHFLLGKGEVPDGLTTEEVLRAYTEDFKEAFPITALSSAFVKLETHAMRIATQAKLIKLLMELCAAFDKERSGKVKLAEVQHTAEEVLGKEKASQLLAGAPTDMDGNLSYAHLTALLTRPPPPLSG
ncbi:unnamed protein product [Phytomonas sp. Hart1]|nr:unnamed protein product [Phytomonas sp. Hart1]|eukprot:CCW66020.1 unnamed protein product [Phytomonas sp. isolate Hart1]